MKKGSGYTPPSPPLLEGEGGAGITPFLWSMQFFSKEKHLLADSDNSFYPDNFEG